LVIQSASEVANCVPANNYLAFHALRIFPAGWVLSSPLGRLSLGSNLLLKKVVARLDFVLETDKPINNSVIRA
jgi:hypothetical protein